MQRKQQDWFHEAITLKEKGKKKAPWATVSMISYADQYLMRLVCKGKLS